MLRPAAPVPLLGVPRNIFLLWALLALVLGELRAVLSLDTVGNFAGVFRRI